jgi:chromosome segregation ATPase
MEYFVTQQEMRGKMSEVSKAHEKELADMNAANLQQQTVDKLAAKLAAAQAELEANKGHCISLQSALNNVTEELEAVRRKLSKTEMKSAEDLQRLTVDRQAETAVLKEELSGLENKTRELIKNEDKIRKQSSVMQASLEASNAETASVKAALHTMDAQLDELIEASNSETASAVAALHAMDAQLDELNGRLAAMKEKSEETHDVDKNTAYKRQALRKKMVRRNSWTEGSIDRIRGSRWSHIDDAGEVVGGGEARRFLSVRFEESFQENEKSGLC